MNIKKGSRIRVKAYDSNVDNYDSDIRLISGLVGYVDDIISDKAIITINSIRVRAFIPVKYLEIYDPEIELSNLQQNAAEKLFWQFDKSRKEDLGERDAFKHTVMSLITDNVIELKNFLGGV